MKFGLINKQGTLNYDGWDKVYDSDEESISFPTSSITVSGLAGNTDEVYKISLVVYTTASGTVLVRPNNDSGSNYGYQILLGTSSTISATRSTSQTAFAGGLGTDGGAGDLAYAEWILYAKSGNERTLVGGQSRYIGGTTVTRTNACGMVWNNTADEITSLVFTRSANNFESGTRIVIHKKVSV